MANSKVTLLRYVRIAQGWRRVRVHAIRKGRGWEERLSAPQGAEILERGEFQLRWYRGGDAVYKGVGHDLQEAITARDNKIANLEAERAALAAGRKLVSDGPGRVALADAKQKFILKKRLVGRDAETVTAYEDLISEFLSGSGMVFADQIEEVDFLRFCDGLRKRGLSERTVMNYHGSIATFLRAWGIDHKTLVPKEHRPHKEDPDPEVGHPIARAYPAHQPLHDSGPGTYWVSRRPRMSPSQNRTRLWPRPIESEPLRRSEF